MDLNQKGLSTSEIEERKKNIYITRDIFIIERFFLIEKLVLALVKKIKNKK